MRTDFVAFVLTHARADRVYTYDTLMKSGYTGAVRIVIDDEDETEPEYRERFGELVYIFDKKRIAEQIDEGDNFNDRRAIIYARNACFEIAKELGFKYFVQLDDDYVDFRHKRNGHGEYIHKKDIRNLDAVFTAMLEYYEATPALSLAMAQGGDFLGGRDGNWTKPKRKCMNSLICSVDRPFQFFGRINEDVNTYTNLGSRGGVFLTIPNVALQQMQTQTNDGGMSGIYEDRGTFVKSFYSVMYQPSSVRISVMPSTYARIHHKVRWRYTVPVILSDEYKKAA
jgi:hypothetical protein